MGSKFELKDKIIFSKLLLPRKIIRKLISLAKGQSAVLEVQYLIKLQAHVKNIENYSIEKLKQWVDCKTKIAPLCSAIEQSKDFIPPPKQLQLRVVGAHFPNFIRSGDRIIEDF